MDSPIIINDKVIQTFYKENPSLDIVTMNHIFIDIIKKLSTNLSANIENTISSQILNAVYEIKENFPI